MLAAIILMAAVWLLVTKFQKMNEPHEKGRHIA